MNRSLKKKKIREINKNFRIRSRKAGYRFSNKIRILNGNWEINEEVFKSLLEGINNE